MNTQPVTLIESIEPEVRTALDSHLPGGSEFVVDDVFDVAAITADVAEWLGAEWSSTGHMTPVEEIAETDDFAGLMDEHAHLPWVYCSNCERTLTGFDPCSDHVEKYREVFGPRSDERWGDQFDDERYVD